MKHMKALILGSVLLPLLIWATCVSIVPQTARAQTAPKYGMMTFESASITISTADQTILSAPGASMRWVVTDISWVISATEANGSATIEDAAGTPVTVFQIPTDTALAGHFSFGQGVPCSQNSAVQVDFSGSTAEGAFNVTGYKERVTNQ